MTSTAKKKQPEAAPATTYAAHHENDTEALLAARERIAKLEEALSARFLDRKHAIRATLGAWIAGGNVFVLGPPGTAKSAMLRAIAGAAGGHFFQTLCNKHQSPDEIFGSISLRAMQEHDVLKRRTEGFLPTADVVFLDEVFKGSSATLNTLLQAMNERTFLNGNEVVRLPTRMFVAASNELPHDDDGLRAFHDRFLVRLSVTSLKVSSLMDLIRRRARAVDFEIPKVSAADLDAIAAAALKVEITEDALEAIGKIVTQVREKGVEVSDRRVEKAVVDLLRVRCAMDGVWRMTSAHLSPLEDVLWNRPEERPHVTEAVRAHVASWLRIVRDLRSTIEKEHAKIEEAMKKPSNSDDALVTLGNVMKAVKQINRSIDEARNQFPDAEAEINDAVAQLDKLRARIKECGQLLGLG